MFVFEQPQMQASVNSFYLVRHSHLYSGTGTLWPGIERADAFILGWASIIMTYHGKGRRKGTSIALLAFSLVSPAFAIWPFPPKRFTGNSLIDAGSMGLNSEGRVIAFGDFNGDQLYVHAREISPSVS